MGIARSLGICGLYGGQVDGGWHGDGGMSLVWLMRIWRRSPLCFPVVRDSSLLHSPAQARPLLVSQPVPRPSHPAIGPRVVFLSAVTLAACFRNAALAVLLHVR